MHNGEGLDNILMVSSAGHSGLGSRVFTSLNPVSMKMTVDTVPAEIYLERTKAADEFVTTDINDLWRPWRDSWKFMPGVAVADVREELKSETTLNELFKTD